MIEQLTIENFACFRHVDVPLKPLTVLIGPNNTGKSCFLRAIDRLLNQSSQAFQVEERWLMDGKLPIVLNARVAGKPMRIHSDQAHRNQILSRNELGVCAVFNLPTGGIPAQSQGVKDSATVPPPISQDSGNIHTILDYYLRRDRKRFNLVVGAMKTRIEGLEDIDIGTPSPETRRVEFRLENDLVLPLNEVSVGSQYIFFFVMLAHHPNAPRFILIEEPENGLHPKRLKDAIGLLRSLTKGEFGAPPSQVILATHSPYLLDFINLDEDEVLVFSRNDDGSRTAQPVNRERLKHFTKEFLLGEIWYNESEEGLVKQSP